MKIDVLRLPYTKETSFVEDITFDSEVFKCHAPLMEVEKCHVELIAQRFEEFIYVTIKIKADVILKCSYTLVDFKTTIVGSDELHFSPDNDEDEDCITYKGTTIELDSYIFNLLSASVPISPKAPNSKAPKSGNGYRVISEDDFFKEKEEQGNSQFDCLKDLDFDD